MKFKLKLRGKWLRPIVLLNSTVEQRLRYEIPLKILGKSEGTILEVGSGSHGITRFMSRQVTGVDISFGRLNMGWLQRVNASACTLPFFDDAFDNVLSVDMLEHLPHEKRSQALNELVRVAAKCLILLTPCGSSRFVDQRLKKKLRPFGVPPWLQEHLQYDLPACETIEKTLREMLDKKGKTYTIKIYGSVNRSVWFWLALTAHLPIVRYLIHLPLLIFSPIFVKHVDVEPCYRRVFVVTFTEATGYIAGRR